MREIIELAHKLQPLALTAIEDGFNLCNTDPEELYHPGHIFSAHFQQRRQANSDRSVGLETLAAAAGAVQSDDLFVLHPAEQIHPARAAERDQVEHGAGNISSGNADASDVQRSGTGLSVPLTSDQQDPRPSDRGGYQEPTAGMFATDAATSSAHAELDALWEADPNGWQTWTQPALDNSLLDWDFHMGHAGSIAPNILVVENAQMPV